MSGTTGDEHMDNLLAKEADHNRTIEKRLKFLEEKIKDVLRLATSVQNEFTEYKRLN